MTDATVDRLNAALEGRYAIERELGEGGMATVYLADDLKHERKVAVKVLKPELAAMVGAERFLTEIKTTARLQHPHILPLHDSGEADGFLYYVMPYIEGETLKDRIDREKQLPVDEALGIATAVANALQTAHDHGVIHRDIKPANILLSQGEPLVADFGIALAVGAAGGHRLTETGLSVGTPFYMSPEQATGDQVMGTASDTYALACVLYEMLVGEPPYLGNTAQAVLGKIIQGIPVSATSVRNSVPANVDAAIRKALEKLPADRFSETRDFAKALADPGFRHGEEAAVASAPTSAWGRALAITGWGAALAIAGWAFFLGAPADAPVSRLVLVPEPGGLDGAFGRYAAVAPDGSSMVLPDTTGPGGIRLALKNRGSTEITPIAGTDQGRDVVYSPDGKWIAYAVGRELRKRPLVGGSTITLAEDVDDGTLALAWLDDGTILYEQETLGAGGPNPLVRISEEGGEPLGVVFQPEEGGLPIRAHGLPGAGGALVIVCPGGSCPANGGDLHVVNLDDGSSTLALEEVIRAWYAPTGHIVYVRTDGAVFAAPFDLGALELTGAGIPLFEGVRTGTAHTDMLLAADGTLLYVEGPAVIGGSRHLVWVDRSGEEEPVDPNEPAQGFTSVALSPDDSRIAVSIRTDQDPADIWVKELPDGPMTKLTIDSEEEYRPVWLSDGATIAYVARATTNDVELRTVASDGSSEGRYEVLLRRDRPVYEMGFTPDGRRMVFREGFSGAGDGDIGLLDLETDSVEEGLLGSDFNERAIALSPDGRWLAYVSNVTGDDNVFVRPFPSTGSGRTQVSNRGGVEPVWAHNGRELFFREPDGWAMMVATYSADSAFDVQSVERLFDSSPYARTDDRTWHYYDVTSDDQRFVMIRPESSGGDESVRLILVQNFFEELKQRVGN